MVDHHPPETEQLGTKLPPEQEHLSASFSVLMWDYFPGTANRQVMAFCHAVLG